MFGGIEMIERVRYKAFSINFWSPITTLPSPYAYTWCSLLRYGSWKFDYEVDRGTLNCVCLYSQTPFPSPGSSAQKNPPWKPKQLHASW
jgi:hypothetical protein